MNSRPASLGILILLCCQTYVPARQRESQTKAAAQNRTIRVKTELVEVRTVVTDRQGRLVDNLRQEDFELFENSRVRPVDFFSVARVETGSAPDATSGKAKPENAASPTSVHARLTGPPARTTVLFVDTFHLSISSVMRVKQILRQFIDEHLTDQDMVALVTSSGEYGITGQFTRDRQILRSAVERIGPGPVPRASFFSPYLASRVERGDREAMNVAIEILRREDYVLDEDRKMLELLARRRASQVLSEASYLRRATLFSLKAFAEQMTALPGQRLIAIFSDGFTLLDTGGHTQTSDLQSVISTAVRSGVAIYTLDAKGLQAPPLFDASMPGIATSPFLMSFVSAAELEEQDGLNSLAGDTGGEMYLNTNDLGGALGKAFDANECYYVLGYYLDPDGDSAQFHRINVRVRNHPEYVVRAPRGFTPADILQKTSQETDMTPQRRLAQAMLAPLPLTALGLSASADCIETDEDTAQVTLTIRLDGDNLGYRQQGERQTFAVEIVSSVYDVNGKRVDRYSEVVEGNLTMERLALARRNGYAITSRLSLKPGVYQARIGAREISSDRMGTATAWMEVPDLTRKRITLSSLILRDTPVTRNTVAPDEKITVADRSRVVQGVRLYTPEQACAYFFRIYVPGGTESGTPLMFQSELLRLGKPLVQSEWRPVPTADRDGKGISVSDQIPLGGLTSGLYELRVTVKDTQSKRTAQRTVIFGVD
jgi:VWFA-related protein